MASDEVARIVADLRKIPDVIGAVVGRRDGIVLTHDVPAEIDPRKIASMAAGIIGTSEIAAEEMGQGRFLQAIVDSARVRVVSLGAGPEATLVVLVRPEANVGLLLMVLGRAAREIAALDSSGEPHGEEAT